MPEEFVSVEPPIAQPDVLPKLMQEPSGGGDVDETVSSTVPEWEPVWLGEAVPAGNGASLVEGVLAVVLLIRQVKALDEWWRQALPVDEIQETMDKVDRLVNLNEEFGELQAEVWPDLKGDQEKINRYRDSIAPVCAPVLIVILLCMAMGHDIHVPRAAFLAIPMIPIVYLVFAFLSSSRILKEANRRVEEARSEILLKALESQSANAKAVERVEALRQRLSDHDDEEESDTE